MLGVALGYSEQALAKILSPRHFVDVRRTLGGPAPDETARAAAVSRQQLAADEQWWTCRDRIASRGRAVARREERGAVNVERDTPMTSTYIQVLVLEAVIVVALWIFGRMFS